MIHEGLRVVRVGNLVISPGLHAVVSGWAFDGRADPNDPEDQRRILRACLLHLAEGAGWNPPASADAPEEGATFEAERITADLLSSVRGTRPKRHGIFARLVRALLGLS